MAKIIYSALVSRIRGSLGGSTFAVWKGLNVLKRRVMRPRQAYSMAQQTIRNLISYLAGSWYALGANQKTMWNTYASLLVGRMSGINAFIRNNTRLLYYGILTEIMSQPPPTPDTPDMLVELDCADALGILTISWTSPTTDDLYVIADRSFLVGLDDGSHPRWTFYKKGLAEDLSIADTHGLTEGTIYRIRCRVLDKLGRATPWSQSFILTATIPAP